MRVAMDKAEMRGAWVKIDTGVARGTRFAMELAAANGIAEATDKGVAGKGTRATRGTAAPVTTCGCGWVLSAVKESILIEKQTCVARITQECAFLGPLPWTRQLRGVCRSGQAIIAQTRRHHPDPSRYGDPRRIGHLSWFY